MDTPAAPFESLWEVIKIRPTWEDTTYHSVFGSTPHWPMTSLGYRACAWQMWPVGRKLVVLRFCSEQNHTAFLSRVTITNDWNRLHYEKDRLFCLISLHGNAGFLFTQNVSRAIKCLSNITPVVMHCKDEVCKHQNTHLCVSIFSHCSHLFRI